MIDYNELPPIEYMHTKECFGSAFIGAVQNWRDAEGMTDFDFAIMCQDGTMNTTAGEYLVSGTSPCKCPVTCPNGAKPWKCGGEGARLQCDMCIGTPVKFGDMVVGEDYLATDEVFGLAGETFTVMAMGAEEADLAAPEFDYKTAVVAFYGTVETFDSEVTARVIRVGA